MENGLVVELELEDVGLTDAVPAELGQLTSLEMLDLMSVPAESADWRRRRSCNNAGGDRAAHLAGERLDLRGRRVPASPR